MFLTILYSSSLTFIITFDDVEQDIMISDACCKYSIENIIINANIICKYIIYYSASVSCNSCGPIYNRDIRIGIHNI